MEDQQIVELYWERSEDAVTETAARFGTYLYQIASRILDNAEDAEECVNDTSRDAWEAMPPHRPAVLKTFLGKITRRIALDVWRKQHAAKRGSGEIALALDELEECVSGGEDPEALVLRQEQAELVRNFVNILPAVERRVLICRYWYLDSVREIADQFGFSESKVTSLLKRSRKKLRVYLEKEGY